MKDTGIFYAEEIAMMEHEMIHEMITESHPLELEQGEWRYYLAGIHDMAQKVIEAVRRKVGE